MKTLVILLGLPGSGKTFYCSDKLKGYTRISQDDLGKAGHFKAFNEALDRGDEYVVIDRVNHDRSQRRNYLAAAKRKGYFTKIVWLNVDRSLCVKRCRERRGHPTLKQDDAEAAISMFQRKWQTPSRKEADELVIVGAKPPFVEVRDVRAEIGDRRYIVCGDVHGCLDELQDLLAELKFDKDEDVLVSVGDLVDRGPKIREALEFVMSLPRFHAVIGNHDDKVVRHFEGKQVKMTMALGTTVAAFGGKMPGEVLEFLRGLPMILRLPGGYVVHAGFHPEMAPEEQVRADCLYMRHYGGTSYFDSINGVVWYKLWPEDAPRVFFGHIPEPAGACLPHYVSLDGGCVFGGYLKAWDSRTGIVHYANARKTYSVNEFTEATVDAPTDAIRMREELVVAGLLRSDRTDDGQLVVYTYTDNCMYDKAWNEITMNSRGHVFNVKTGEPVACAMKKFFNLFETPATMAEVLPWDKPYDVYEKLDGCIRRDTALDLWEGGTIRIGDIVRDKLTPTLVGQDDNGNLVPAKVLDHFDNGTKDNWLAIKLRGIDGTKVSRKVNVLRITSNHKIHINGKFQAAEKAKPGDNVVTYGFVPDTTALHLMEAGLLGDGSVTWTQNGAKYRDVHKKTHAAYVQYIHERLGPCAINIGKCTSGFGTPMLIVTSRDYPELKQLREKWYPKNKKRVPIDLSWIDDFAVAKWYMDDGSLSHSDLQQDRAHFATNGFPKADVKRLAAKLSSMYGVKCTVYNSKGWAIRVNAGRNASIDVFWSAIARYVVPCMRYKLPERYRNAPFSKYAVAKELRITKMATITSVKSLASINKKNFPAGRIGFDIKTSTGNYFAKGILIHNCLGILYRHDHIIKVSSRGSFHSEHSQWATKFIQSKDLSFLPDEATLCFEMIDPSLRIILDYGSTSMLVILAAFNRFTGEEYPRAQVEEWAKKADIPIVRRYENMTLDDLQLIQREGKGMEGFVIRFHDGTRVKVKTEWYTTRAKIMSRMTPIALWEAMKDGLVLKEFLVGIPEEIRPLAEQFQSTLESQYAAVLKDIQEYGLPIIERFKGDRKQIAMAMQTDGGKAKLGCKFPGTFSLLDGEKGKTAIDKLIMGEIYPTGNDFKANAISKSLA